MRPMCDGAHGKDPRFMSLTKAPLQQRDLESLQRWFLRRLRGHADGGQREELDGETLEWTKRDWINWYIDYLVMQSGDEMVNRDSQAIRALSVISRDVAREICEAAQRSGRGRKRIRAPSKSRKIGSEQLQSSRTAGSKEHVPTQSAFFRRACALY